jgi:hypothetical protein
MERLGASEMIKCICGAFVMTWIKHGKRTYLYHYSRYPTPCYGGK